MYDDDSGWRFLAADESKQDFDPRCAALSLGALLRIDDSFLSLLSLPAPCAFARDRETGEFKQIQVSEMESQLGGTFWRLPRH